MNASKPAPFLGLKESDLRSISAHAVTRSFARNSVVITEGDRSDSLYIILSGRVKFYGSDEQGKEIVLPQAGPGEYFGEISLDEGPRSASVMTIEPTRFSIVPREDFRDFLAQSPEFAFNLVSKLIHRVRVLIGNVKSLALMDIYGRVAHMPLELAAERDGVLAFEDKPTQPGHGQPRRRLARNDRQDSQGPGGRRLHQGGTAAHCHHQDIAARLVTNWPLA